MASKRIVAIGGSDAGISAALRARELDPDSEVTVVVADAYPNFSICGIPYYVSGEVDHWSNLAHRTLADLKATGMQVRTNTLATGIDVSGKRVLVRDSAGWIEELPYDALIVGTGAVSARPPIEGLSGPDALGPADGVHLLHNMGDTFAVMQSIAARNPKAAVVIGAGYIGLEMAEALTTRGLHVTQIEALPEVLPTVDRELGALVHDELTTHGVEVLTNTQVSGVGRAPADNQLLVQATGTDGKTFTQVTDLVLVVVGVRPDTTLAATAGARLGVKGAIDVDEYMRTSLPDVYAAGDCAVTHHRLLGKTWLPLGTTAHKQGRIAGENALGGTRWFAGSLGTPGGQGLRPRRRPHRPARPRSRRRQPGLDTGDHREPPRRPQGVLPRRHPDLHPRHRRHRKRPPARRPARRTAKRGDLQARRHLRHRALPRHAGRHPQRTRPLLHPTPGLPVGRGPGRGAGMDERTPPRRAAPHAGRPLTSLSAGYRVCLPQNH